MLTADPALQELATGYWQLTTGNRQLATDNRQLTTGYWLLTTDFTLQRQQRFVVNVPLLQDAEDYAAAEAGPHQHAKDARRLLLANRLDNALALQELTRQLLFVHLAVGRAHNAFDDVSVNALCLQVLHHAHAPELFILLAEAGVAFGVVRVIQIALLFQARDDHFDQQLAVRLIADAFAH